MEKESKDINEIIEQNLSFKEKKENDKKIIKLGRRRLRENVFKLIFGLEFEKLETSLEKQHILQNLDDKVEIFAEIEEIYSKEDIDYLKNFLKIYIENYDEVNQIVETNLKETWNINRISKISKSLIKLAIVEISKFETPYKIVINEVIELSKLYQEEKETKFVNGILASYVSINKEVEEKKKTDSKDELEKLDEIIKEAEEKGK